MSFDEAGKKVNNYCPGLNVELDLFTWHKDGSRSVLICQYDSTYQEVVADYFADPKNNYSEDIGHKYFMTNKPNGPLETVDSNTVGKIISKDSVTASVYFDRTKARIIIVEQKTK